MGRLWMIQAGDFESFRPEAMIEIPAFCYERPVLADSCH